MMTMTYRFSPRKYLLLNCHSETCPAEPKEQNSKKKNRPPPHCLFYVRAGAIRTIFRCSSQFEARNV